MKDLLPVLEQDARLSRPLLIIAEDIEGDPTKVVRSALQHAASIASLLLTMEAVITQIPERNMDAAMLGPLR